MKNELQQLNARRDCVTIAVSETDIEEMWNRFDSGMCDLTTANAVAIAINRTLQSKKSIRVVSDAWDEEFHCLFDDEIVSLPIEVSVWLSRCLRGIREEPIHFGLSLPSGLIREGDELLFAIEEEGGESIAA